MRDGGLTRHAAPAALRAAVAARLPPQGHRSAPAVPNLTAASCPLIGGRLDYLDGHAVAAFAYRRDKHVIDVFVQPGGPPGSATLKGYNLVGGEWGGMAYRQCPTLTSRSLRPSLL